MTPHNKPWVEHAAGIPVSTMKAELVDRQYGHYHEAGVGAQDSAKVR